jgi:hypothetical protein
MPKRKSLLQREAAEFIGGSPFVPYSRRPKNSLQHKNEIDLACVIAQEAVEREKRREEKEILKWERNVNHSWHDEFCDCGRGLYKSRPPPGQRWSGCFGWCGCHVNRTQRMRSLRHRKLVARDKEGICKGCGSRAIQYLYNRIDYDREEAEIVQAIREDESGDPDAHYERTFKCSKIK